MEQTFARELLDFLDASPSCYHAAANVAAALEQAGYWHLMEFEPWHLERGGAYYVMRGDSAVAAFAFSQAGSVALVLVFGMLLSASNLGAWGVLYAVTPEIYPTRLRGAAAGAAAAVGRIAAIIAPLLMPWFLTLSGGNKQKVSFAKWSAKDSDVLIMDCPTRGVDVGVKQAMYSLIEEMKAQGKAILMISEELAELIGMADRLIILKDFQVTKTFQRSPDLKETDIIEYMV